MSAIWVVIDSVKGSSPRDPGTAMKVTLDGTEGTIGGGALEHTAIETARGMLEETSVEISRTYPLGPALGQCCGGAVTLRYTRTAHATDMAAPLSPTPLIDHPIWLWGAGHVGRAVVAALAHGRTQVTWVDTALDRFPREIPPHVTPLPAADMPRLAQHADPAAHHYIFTFSHDIDLALCAALLDRGAASIGLIGSDTKRARFFKRLRALGLDPAPIICPIGDKTLGKAPHQIAQGVVGNLIKIKTAA